VQLIDDEGRIFGKFNLVDVLAGIVLLGIVPVAYIAFVLFQTPDVSIQSIEPNRVTADSVERLRVTGMHLRPSLRVVIGGSRVESFLVESQTSAEFSLPDLSAGTYDVILLDEELEVARLVDAVTVESTPAMTISSVKPTYALTGEPGNLRIQGKRFEPYLSARFIPDDDGPMIEAPAFLLESATDAEIRLPQLPVGDYELVLYDAEDVRQGSAAKLFTVTPPPTITSPERCEGVPCIGGARMIEGQNKYLYITGEYFDPLMWPHFEPYLSEPYSEVYESPESIFTERISGDSINLQRARILLPDLRPGTYTFVLVLPAEQRFGGEPRELARVQGLLTVLPDPGALRSETNKQWIIFLDSLLATQRLARVTIRFVTRPELQLSMQPGDTDTLALADETRALASLLFIDSVDTERLQSFIELLPTETVARVLELLVEGRVASGLSVGRSGDARVAAEETWNSALAGDQNAQRHVMRILEAEEERKYAPSFSTVQSVGPRSLMKGSGTVGLPLSGPGPSYITDQPVEVFDAVVDVPVTLTRAGWAYHDQYIKVGGLFHFESVDYVTDGWVLDMELLGGSDKEP